MNGTLRPTAVTASLRGTSDSSSETCHSLASALTNALAPAPTSVLPSLHLRAVARDLKPRLAELAPESDCLDHRDVLEHRRQSAQLIPRWNAQARVADRALDSVSRPVSLVHIVDSFIGLNALRSACQADRLPREPGSELTNNHCNHLGHSPVLSSSIQSLSKVRAESTLPDASRSSILINCP